MTDEPNRQPLDEDTTPEAILRAALDKIRRRTSITFGSGTMSNQEAFNIAADALRLAYNGGGYGQTPKGMKPWNGGPRHLPPHDWRVGCTVKYRGGDRSKGGTEYGWDHTGGPYDIVSYEPCDLATWVPEDADIEPWAAIRGQPLTGVWTDEADEVPPGPVMRGIGYGFGVTCVLWVIIVCVASWWWLS